MTEELDYPLHGIRVVDLSQALAGPSAAMYLGDQGAEVIKVEPVTGDSTRRGTGITRMFLGVNRNKRGIAVDIRQPQGREIIYRLVERADVLLHNYPPGRAERFQLDYPPLKKLNPRLVYAWVNGWGTEGPYGSRRGADFPIQAMSGILSRQRSPDGSPLRAGLWPADMSAPMLLAYGITLALLMRMQTGEGRMVTTSLIHAALAMQTVNLVQVERGLPEDERVGYGNPERYNWSYLCNDGSYLAILVTGDQEWERLCGAVGKHEWASDQRYGKGSARRQNGMELYEQLCAVFRTRSRAEWLTILHNADVMCAPVNEWSDVFEDPQISANHLFMEMEHPLAGQVRTVAPGGRLSEVPASPNRRPPLLGEHTRAVLSELGYEDAAIRLLEDDNIVNSNGRKE